MTQDLMIAEERSVHLQGSIDLPDQNDSHWDCLFLNSYPHCPQQLDIISNAAGTLTLEGYKRAIKWDSKPTQAGLLGHQGKRWSPACY